MPVFSTCVREDSESHLLLIRYFFKPTVIRVSKFACRKVAVTFKLGPEPGFEFFR